MPISGSRFKEISELGLKDNEVALMWFNNYSGFVFKTSKSLIIVDPVDLPNEALEILEPDIIFISHEHYDHYNKGTVTKLSKNKSKIVAPRHIIMDLHGSVSDDTLHVIKAGESLKHNDIELIGFEASHPSPEPLTLVLIAENGITIYHAIDSATFDGMREVGEKYKPDIAIVPIGIAPRTSPKEGLRAITLIRPKIAIPHHATKGFNEFKSLVNSNLPEVSVKVLDKGEIWIYSK